MLINEYEISKSMVYLYRGLFRICEGFRAAQIIKDTQSKYNLEPNTSMVSQNSYNQRFGYFKPLMVPRFKGFDSYQDDLSQIKQKFEFSNDDELGSKLITEGLEFLKQSKECLKNLQETPA